MAALSSKGDCEAGVDSLPWAALKFGGWQRLNAEYAKQFGVEPSARSACLGAALSE
jgi:hypothetical protein